MTADVFDLGAVPARFPVTVELARRLVAAQFPQWADLPVRPVAEEGWDNRTFHLGSEMSLRLPSAAPYALAVEKEHRWLPALAPCLPVPIPVPLALGRPGREYPYSWSVYRWLDGEPAARDNLPELTRFATDLAGFLAALRRFDPSGGPSPGLHNWYRGGSLSTYDKLTQDALDALDGSVRTGLARQIWQASLRARWDGTPVWFHGDVAATNLLVAGGTLVAVIDFGTCGVGDPACDLAIAWTLFTDESRTAFRNTLSVDDESWARGRGWALWKTLGACAAAESSSELATARCVLDEILDEYERSAN